MSQWKSSDMNNKPFCLGCWTLNQTWTATCCWHEWSKSFLECIGLWNLALIMNFTHLASSSFGWCNNCKSWSSGLQQMFHISFLLWKVSSGLTGNKTCSICAFGAGLCWQVWYRRGIEVLDMLYSCWALVQLLSQLWSRWSCTIFKGS